ncbi:copper amine oxidase [Brevibacillus choshinensis]|uniref:Copper amine oxidase n=1 Tax=Brevibacillus choshinensis TaxID=54911 RepID=A0ABR5N4T4_BRECH|nr:stalk domain-containing protein [Brevibacillus choshinensis]KQL45637.1 copper amine oxidase [Brevibacillus choshinensis]
MKGKILLAATLGMQMLVAYPAAAAPASPAAAHVYVNGEQASLEKAPILVDQRTYVSASDASQILQADWTMSAGSGVLKLSDEQSFTFGLKDGKVAVNGKWSEKGQGAIVRDGQVYLPLRWLVEQAGGKVAWNAEKKAVEIMAALHEGSLVLLTDDKLTKEEQAYVESVKKKQGIYQQGKLYVVARGESPNPGYGLQVTHTQWSWEQLLVYVKQTKPEPGKMYTQAITYPHIVAKADLPPYTTVVFLDADTKKPLFAPEK